MKRSFSPSDAAFEGFRIIHRYPGAVAAWALAYILVVLLLGGGFFALFGSQFMEMSRYSEANTMPAETARRIFGGMGLALLILVPVALLISAVLLNGVYRAVLRPNDKGLFFLKIGGDELRMALLFIIFFLLLIVAELVAVIGGGILIAVATSLVGQPALKVLIGVVLGVAIACVAIWVVVRLSLAPVVTFARQRLDVFGSWRLTKGNFWSLLGCYLLSFVFALLIGAVGWVIAVSAGAAISGDWTSLSSVMVSPRDALMHQNTQMFTKLFTAAVIVQLVLQSIVSAVTRVIMYAPAAAAYRELAAEEDLSDFKVRANGLVL